MSEACFQVEFTSRYDGHPPSWLRGCFVCEAMGAYPVKAHLATHPNLKGKDTLPAPLADRERAHVEATIAAGGYQDDGWYCVPCLHCGGSARVSWLRTIARIPRWLWRGVPFVWESRRFNGDAGVWANCWMAFKCAYLVDLGLWKP